MCAEDRRSLTGVRRDPPHLKGLRPHRTALLLPTFSLDLPPRLLATNGVFQ